MFGYSPSCNEELNGDGVAFCTFGLVAGCVCSPVKNPVVTNRITPIHKPQLCTVFDNDCTKESYYYTSKDDIGSGR